MGNLMEQIRDWRGVRQRAAALLVTLSLVAAACGDDGDDVAADDATTETSETTAVDAASEGEEQGEAANGEPVQLGVIASLTGPGAPIGVPFLDAAEVAVKSVNANGGVLDGRPLELIVRDDETKPEVAVQHFEALAREGVAWMLGPNLTSTCYATEPLSQSLNVPMYCWSGADLPEEFPLFFAPHNDFGQVAAGLMSDMEALGIGSFAMLSSTDASGLLYAETMKEAAAEAGIEVTDAREFDVSETDLTGTLASMRETNPEAYFIGTSGKAAAIALKNGTDLQIQEPFFIGFGNGSYEFAELVGSNIPDNTYVRTARVGDPASIAEDDPIKEESEAYLAAWEEEYGTMADPNASAVWDSVKIIAQAMDETGGTDPEAMVEYIESLEYAGANCTYEFSAEDHRGTADDCLGLLRLVGDGTFESVDLSGS